MTKELKLMTEQLEILSKFSAHADGSQTAMLNDVAKTLLQNAADTIRSQDEEITQLKNIVDYGEYL